MKKYDINKPLVVIHIPKAAGTSSRQFFKEWYGDGFYFHYYDEWSGEMPPKVDIATLHTKDNPVVVHGHFNKYRGFGLQDYYPSVDQFVTILRDPYELLISHYFFINKYCSEWASTAMVPTSDLETYLKTTKPNMLNHFPEEINFNNYKDIIEEFFIEVGITEKLSESMSRISKKLGFSFDAEKMQYLNKTERSETLPDSFKDQFIELNPLEFDVYEYALSKYA